MKVKITPDAITLDDGNSVALVITHPQSYEDHAESVKKLITRAFQADKAAGISFEIEALPPNHGVGMTDSEIPDGPVIGDVKDPPPTTETTEQPPLDIHR